MSKVKALLFTAKCFLYICWRILHSREWNSFTVNLQEKNEARRILRYMKHSGSIDLEDLVFDKGSIEPGS